MHPFKVLVRTQSVPVLWSERGVQCLRSWQELNALRESYLVKRQLSSK